MAINKNFVVKNGFEVNTKLILADANTQKVGIGSTGPRFELDVAGGIGATNFYLSGIGTFVDELNVGSDGSILTVLGVGGSVGVGTALPGYLLDVRSPVSTGQTALYIQGDVQITGDLQVDDISFDDASVNNLTITEALNVTFPGISTLGGYVDINNDVDISGTLNVSGITTLGNVVDINSTVDISNTLNVGGATTLGGYVDINDSVDISDNLNLVGNLNVVGLTTLGNVVDINSTVDISNTLNVGSATTLGGYVDINDSVDISVDLNVVGVTTLGNTVDINSTVDISNTLNVGGATTLGGYVDINNDVDISGTLNVSGITTLATVDINAGDIEVSNVDTTDLNVTGISTLSHLNAGNVVISGISTFNSYVDLSNDLIVSGLTTISNTTDSTTFSNGALTIDGGLGVQKSVNIGGDLDVTGSVFIGGTTVTLRGIDVFIENKDIVLGFTTAVTPNDDTANHAGIAIASTEGSPLASFTASGINTLPDTYKQLMWFRSGTLGFSTDAFAFNYGVAIGTTIMADGVRLAVGSDVTVTDTSVIANSIVTDDIIVSGIATLATVNINAGDIEVSNVDTTDLNVTGIATFSSILVNSGIVSAASGVVTYYGDGNNLDISSNPSIGIGIGTDGGLVGYGATFINFFGAGVSTSQYEPTIGIATIFFNGGGGSGTPGGIDGTVQYNVSGSFAGSTNFTFDGSNVNVSGVVTATDFNSSSDQNLKTNIETIENALDITSQLRGVSFDWKETGSKSYGVIAQELEKVLPDLVKTGELKTVNYSGIIGVLIEAIKELKEDIEDLKKYK
jgi:hypothetical protein